MNSSRRITFLLFVADVVSTLLVFNLVAYSRAVPDRPLLEPLAVPTILLVAAIYLIDGYRARTDMGSADYVSSHTIAVVSAMLVTLLLTFVILPAGYELRSSRIVIVLGFVLTLAPTLGVRQLLQRRVGAERGKRSLLFVGDRESRAGFREECRKMGVRQPVLFSWVGADESGAGENDGDLLALGDALGDIRAGRLVVEAVVLRESNRVLPPEAAQELVQLYFEGIPTYTLELFHQIYWQKIPLYRLNPTWLFQEGFQIAREPVFERLKRVTDFVFSLLGLILAAPLLAALGLAIWIEDRGPVFFRQTRIGKNQEPFRVVKLRTMRANSESGDPYTQPADARVTRVGRFLRAGRLDELPQLWNVLSGEMSLIGPRAEWSRLAEEYQRKIPCYNYRHLVKPGITGWAQVNFTYGASLEDAVRKLEYDLYYIRHFSFVLDASIALKTIQVILFGKGR